MEKLSVHELQVGYEGLTVLSAVDLRVSSGDFWGVVGPNGSGKSTLLRTLSRHLQPLAGVVLLDGRDLAQLSPGAIARQMAVMEAEVREGLAFRVREFVAYGRTPYQNWLGQLTDADSEAIDRALLLTGITELQDRRLDDLSSGERQRVQLAQALAQEPQVLLLDEPTAHLDLHYQVEMMRMLEQISSRGVCLVAVLHDLNLAAAYCRFLLAVHQGGVVGMGPPPEVLTKSILTGMYGNTVEVGRHPGTGLPFVLPAFRQPL